MITRIVSFKVVNGSWDDGKTEDINVALTAKEDETIKLPEDVIPSVGTNPNAGYKKGSWDKTPQAGAAIAENTLYTYTYDKDDTPEPTPTPTPTPMPTPTPTDASVTLNVSETTVTQGTEKALKATTTPEGTTVTWSSSNPSVASVDGNGVVKGIKAGTVTITATIKVDGKEYSASCKVTVVPVGYIPPKKTGDEHVHKFIWETFEATEEEDGELRYQCEICGYIQTRVPLTAYNVFNKNTTEKIRKAPRNATVMIKTAKWISFHKMVMEALTERPDITMEISFLDEGYKGNRCTVVIPKGTDAMSLVDKNGFTGFLCLGGKFGLKTD